MSFELIAHRGFPHLYPENSMLGINAAIEAGAKNIEIDIQMSRDNIPMVFHDDNLKRITGIDEQIYFKSSQELKKIAISEKEKFGEKFIDEKLPTLLELVIYLTNKKDVHLFVELKQESLKHVGVELMVKKVLSVLQPIINHCVIISYDKEALIITRKLAEQAIGLVITDYDQKTKSWSKKHQPEYLFADREAITKKQMPLWKGAWKWAFFEYSLSAIKEWVPENVNLIETDNIAALINYQNSIN